MSSNNSFEADPRRLLPRYLIALAAGWFVAGSVLQLLALIAAAPGLRGLMHAVRAAGLPLQYVYPLLTSFVPVFLLAFIVGVPVFKSVRDHRGWLLLVTLLPWAAHAAFGYLVFCVGTEFACFGVAPFQEILGLLNVPLGFAIAALVTRPTRPPNPDMPITTDDKGSEDASSAPLLHRRRPLP
jgi:hypothetical protein